MAISYILLQDWVVKILKSHMHHEPYRGQFGISILDRLNLKLVEGFCKTSDLELNDIGFVDFGEESCKELKKN